MILGFTGTQRGLTKHQVEVLEDEIDGIKIDSAVHGGCVGADETFHAICVDRRTFRIDIWPSNIKEKQGDCPSGNATIVVVHDEMPPLVRNSVIVQKCSLLIACPGEAHEVLRSGTWATVRKARNKSLPVLIIYPSGDKEL